METQNSFLPLRDLTEMTAPLNRLKMSMTDPMVDFTQFWNEVSGTPLSRSKEHARPREETSSTRYHVFRLEERRSAAFNDNSPQATGLQKMPALAFFSLLRRVPCPGGYIHFIVLVMCQEQGMGDRIYVEGPGGAAAAPGKVQRKFAQTKSEFLSRICSNTL